MNTSIDAYEPRLDLPDFVGKRPNREWSAAEAREMFDATLRRVELVPRLLQWLGVDPDQPCAELLLGAGEKATPILQTPELLDARSEYRPDDTQGSPD